VLPRLALVGSFCGGHGISDLGQFGQVAMCVVIGEPCGSG
jgi:hypothetical protein